MTFLRAYLLCLFCLVLGAEDTVATWVSGPGAEAGAVVAAGGVVTAPDDGLVTLELIGIPDSRLIVGAGSAVGLQRAEGGRELIISLQRGLLELDLPPGGERSLVIRVRGGACESTVTGTLFVVQRVERDQDFVALVRGRLSVARLGEDALEQARRRREALDLEAGQGLSAGPQGLGRPGPLVTKPQVMAAIAEQLGIRELALAGDGSLTDSARTDALADTEDEDKALTESLNANIDKSLGESAQVALGVDDAVAEEIVEEIVEEVAEEVGDLGVIEPEVFADDLIEDVAGDLADDLNRELDNPPEPPN